eukprot:5415850-Heterocapsa_arctica.AAC.1
MRHIRTPEGKAKQTDKQYGKGEEADEQRRVLIRTSDKRKGKGGEAEEQTPAIIWSVRDLQYLALVGG